MKIRTVFCTDRVRWRLFVLASMVTVAALLYGIGGNSEALAQRGSQARKNEREATAVVLNRSTQQMEHRKGNTARTKDGSQIWFHPPVYAGGSFVHLSGVGYVRMDSRYETSIYPALASGVSDQIENALGLIQGSAIMQGMMALPESDGD